MIRARMTNGDFLFGLDAENVARLKAGNPIRVKLAPMGGPDMAIVIIYGETLQAIAEDLEKKMGPLPPPMNLIKPGGPVQ